jgi:gamma-glutamylcyclotransferase (GGCT)/AIG2-like uncharacterized protein YtfP
MPLLFSYGSLQREDVQLATFARRLAGSKDALPGFELATSTRGPVHHANLVPGAADGGRVEGMVFGVTEAELALADEYERRDCYHRIEAVLVSGRSCWVYVEAPLETGR